MLHGPSVTALNSGFHLAYLVAALFTTAAVVVALFVLRAEVRIRRRPIGAGRDRQVSGPLCTRPCCIANIAAPARLDTSSFA